MTLNRRRDLNPTYHSRSPEITGKGVSRQAISDA
jgi:hypothetical protein